MNTPLRKDPPLNLRRIIRAEDVRMVPVAEKGDTIHDSPPTIAEGGVTGHEPEITLLKDGDLVKAIVIKCTCGKITTLDCEY